MNVDGTMGGIKDHVASGGRFGGVNLRHDGIFYDFMMMYNRFLFLDCIYLGMRIKVVVESAAAAAIEMVLLRCC